MSNTERKPASGVRSRQPVVPGMNTAECLSKWLSYMHCPSSCSLVPLLLGFWLWRWLWAWASHHSSILHRLAHLAYAQFLLACELLSYLLLIFARHFMLYSFCCTSFFTTATKCKIFAPFLLQFMHADDGLWSDWGGSRRQLEWRGLGGTAKTNPKSLPAGFRPSLVIAC